MLNFFIAAVVLFSANLSFGQSHSSINSMRSTYNKNFYFDQSIIGYTGSLNVKKADSESYEGALVEKWNGYGIRDGFGLELYKFIHLSVLHTHIQEQEKGKSTKHFQGSELMGDASFVFASPAGDLGFGTGMFTSRINLQNEGKSSSYGGVGRIDHISWNYFVNSSFSFTAKAERGNARYYESFGDTGLKSFQVKRDGFALGFKIWL